MARKRRSFTVFSLSFLDVMSCGFGAVVLVFMIINHSTEARSNELNRELLAEVSRLEEQVLGGEEHLVRLVNSIRKVDDERVVTEGLAERIIKTIREIQIELAALDKETLAQSEHINALKAHLKSVEENTKRLEESIDDEQERGDDIRTFVGEGDRQYLTALRMGGERILILVDSSASMLDETIVNIIRRRNLPDEQKITARKWQRVVRTADWITTQVPPTSKFQIYSFNVEAKPVVAETGGQWLEAGDGTLLNQAIEGLRQLVPEKGTSLYHAFAVIGQLDPRPDNVYLLTDGLPTQGESPPRRATVDGRGRLRYFERSLDLLPASIPMNIILFPMEGDPMAASSYWQLAMATSGSFMSPSKDWP